MSDFKIWHDRGLDVGWPWGVGIEIRRGVCPPENRKVKVSKTRFLRFSPTLGAHPGPAPGASQDLSDGVCAANGPLQNAEKILAPGAGVTPRRIFENWYQKCHGGWYPLITRKRSVRFWILKFRCIGDGPPFPTMCPLGGSDGAFAPHKIPKLVKNGSFSDFQKIADRKW